MPHPRYVIRQGINIRSQKHPHIVGDFEAGTSDKFL
jgi:hypothetical protein